MLAQTREHDSAVANSMRERSAFDDLLQARAHARACAVTVVHFINISVEVFDICDYSLPTNNTDFQISKYVGIIKLALEHSFSKSSYHNVLVVKSPTKAVVTKFAFKPEGLKLSALSNSIGCVKEVPPSALDLGGVFDHQIKGHTVRVFIKPCNVYPLGFQGNLFLGVS